MSKRFSLAAALFVSIALIAADKPTDCCNGKSCCAAKATLVQKVYEVADLVIPIPGVGAEMTYDHPGCCAECLVHGATPLAKTQEDELIKLIARTVSPSCWWDVGGACTLEYFPVGNALVVQAPLDVQEKVAGLLASLRRLQDVQVAVELKFICVGESFFERVGVDFNVKGPATCPPCRVACAEPNCTVPPQCNQCGMAKTAALTQKQVAALLETLQGDRRCNVMSAPKLTVLNGQSAMISCCDTQNYVTGVKSITANGQALMVPENQPHELGLKAHILPTISADHRFVQIYLKANHSEVAGEVPLMPVTYFQTPIKADGTPGQPVPFTQFIQQPKINTLTVDCNMCIPDGGTTLIDAGTLEREEKWEHNPPVLSKIPYVNRLFKSGGVGRETYHMLVMVTPRVLVLEEAGGCASCKNCQDAKCCDNCPKCCEDGCKTCPKCKPAAGEEEANVPAAPLPHAVKMSAVEMRAEKMAAKLVEKYHDACGKGETEKARKLARQALDLDPACFTKPQGTHSKGTPVGRGVNSDFGVVGQITVAPAPMPHTDPLMGPQPVPQMQIHYQSPSAMPISDVRPERPGLFKRIFHPQVWAAQTLPSSYYLEHGPQNFRPDADFPLEKELTILQVQQKAKPELLPMPHLLPARAPADKP